MVLEILMIFVVLVMAINNSNIKPQKHVVYLDNYALLEAKEEPGFSKSHNIYFFNHILPPSVERTNNCYC